MIKKTVFVLLVLSLVYCVSAATPISNFSSNVTSGLIPFAVKFTDTSSSNLILYPENFSASQWTKSDISNTVNNITSPSGVTTGNYLQEDIANTNHYISQVVSRSAGTEYYSIYAKKNQRDRFGIYVGEGTPLEVSFDLTNGAILYNSSTAIGTISDVGNGWYLCRMTSISSSGAETPTVYIYLLGTGQTSAASNIYQGDGVSGLYLWGSSLTLDNTSPVTSWSWSFGDGQTSTAQNPTNTYSTLGVYTVSLVATNADGSNTSTKTITVHGYTTTSNSPWDNLKTSPVGFFASAWGLISLLVTVIIIGAIFYALTQGVSVDSASTLTSLAISITIGLIILVALYMLTATIGGTIAGI